MQLTGKQLTISNIMWNLKVIYQNYPKKTLFPKKTLINRDSIEKFKVAILHMHSNK